MASGSPSIAPGALPVQVPLLCWVAAWRAGAARSRGGRARCPWVGTGRTCHDEYPADPAPAPQQCTQAVAGAAASTPIDRMGAEQRVERSTGPPWDRADPAIATLGAHGGAHGTAQRLAQQLVAGLVHVRAHVGIPGLGRSHDAIPAPMRAVVSTQPARDTAVLITGVAPAPARLPRPKGRTAERSR